MHGDPYHAYHAFRKPTIYIFTNHSGLWEMVIFWKVKWRQTTRRDLHTFLNIENHWQIILKKKTFPAEAVTLYISTCNIRPDKNMLKCCPETQRVTGPGVESPGMVHLPSRVDNSLSSNVARWTTEIPIRRRMLPNRLTSADGFSRRSTWRIGWWPGRWYRSNSKLNR